MRKLLPGRFNSAAALWGSFAKKAVTGSSYRLLLSFLLALVFMLGMAGRAQAQVYYLTSDANATTLSTDDALNRMNYDGSSNTRLVSSFSNSPVRIEQDLAGGRLFIYEALAAQKSIKIVNSSTGAITKSISVPYNVSSMRYDAASDYIYFTTTSGGIALDVSDALYKVKTTDTNPTLIASSITTSPLFLALDLPNNRVFIYESVPANRGIKTFSLASNSITQSATINSGTVVDIAYEPTTDYIYYLTNDGSATTTSATDALSKIQPGANTSIVIKSFLTGSPGQCMALDYGNNRLFFYEALTANRAIKAVNLTDGTVTQILSLTSYATGITLPAMCVPAVPTATTTAASNISSASATLGGNITRSDASVTARGIVYSSSNSTPTIGGAGVTQAANGTGTGVFSASITGLSGSTTYYVRSYATSGAGTAYGAVSTFTTLSNDATLSGLTTTAGTLTPAFASGTTSYTASVTNATTTVTVTPAKNNTNAAIKVNGTAVTSGSASGNISLGIGDNAINTVVTAQDGTTTKTYTITVNRPKAAQTITFNALPAKNYGDANFAPGATASSGLTVSYSSGNTAVATIVSGQIHIVAAGTAVITATQAGDANNLAASSVTQTLTVNKAAQTITFGTLAAKTYGNADFAPGATTNASGLTVTYISSNTAVATIVSNQIHIVGVGTTDITASQSGDANRLAAASIVQSLAVNKATVTITAAAKTRVYGDTDPALTFSASGVIGSDAATGSLTRAAGESIGDYAISQGSVSYGNNYNITYVTNNLTITKRLITLQPAPATKVYGAADPTFPYYFRVGSLAPGEGITGTFGRASGESVGTYALTLGTKRPVNVTTGADVSGNYTISFLTEDLTITKKPITVTANVQSKTYGDADPALTYVNTTLSFNDSFSGTLTRAAGEQVGTYAISQGTLTISNNYTLTYTGANLTIGKKIINVTADAKSKIYGDTDPALTYTNDALATGDSFTGAITRAVGEGAGAYVITQGDLSLNTNYALNFTGASLTIGQATLTYTATPASRPYQTLNPTFTGTVSGFKNGDTQASALTGTLAFNTSATESSPQGSYPINGSGLSSAANYTFVQAASNNTALTITASADATLADLSLSNGAILSPSFDAATATYTSFVGNGVSSITITPTVSESHANIKVNGTAVASGAASGSIALNIGDNIITTVVTAQDGSTTKTYTTTVTRSDYPTPTNFASNLTFTNTTTSATTLSWTNGTGTSRAVFMTTGTTGNAQTANNSTYTANAAYGSGSTNSNGWYCVYNGTGSTVNISALNAGTDYRVRVVEYNGPAGYEKYIPVGGYANVTTVSNHTGINAIARNSAALTNGSSVQYTVSFDDNISGLTTDNFSLTGTASAATIASLSGSGKTYMVTVNAGGVDGTIVLNLANATGISPGIDTPLPYAGMTYTIDRTPPSATSAAFVSNNVLDHAHAKVGDVVTIAFTTTEPIQTPVISIAGHSVTPTNLNSSVSWAASYQLTSGDTEGNVHFSVNFNDLAGNAVNGGIPVTEANSGSILIFDKTAPAVNSISRQNPASVSTPANALTYRVTFTEPVLSVAKTAFTLNATGASAGTVSGVTQVSQTTYDVSVSGVSGAGTLRLDLKSAPTGITDLSGNAPTAGFTSGEAYTIQTAPSVITLAASNVGTTSATVNGTVNDNFDATIAGFQYNTSADFSGRPIGVATTGGSIAAGTGQTAAALTLTNLNPNTTYYYRITAGNNQGQTDGATLSFTTSPPPAVAPTQQAYALTFSGTTMSTTTVSWTSGNGAARAVFMSQTTNGSTAPANNTTYTANSNYGLGSQSPNSWYCVYNGTGSSVNISGLTPGATYRVHVVDYNGVAGNEKYLSSPSAPANVTTLSGAPANAASGVTFANTTTTTTDISWTNGGGVARAVFITQATNGNASPADNITYTSNANFGNGKQAGTSGWYCIYNGTGTSASVKGLTPGLTYRVHVVEYNGTINNERYLTSPAHPANVTTLLATPTSQAYHLAFDNTTSTSTGISWTNGNGSSRVVFMAQTNNGNTVPSDNTTYTANSSLAAGTQVGSTGWYCVYNGSSNNTVVNGLTGGATYRVLVLEYNGTAGIEKYLTTSGSPANVTPVLSAPATAANAVTFSNTTGITTNVSWTNGGGAARSVFIAKTNTGSSAPADNTGYTSNTNFGNGKQIGSTGWYCIYTGTGSSASVTGLTPNTTYRVHVVEYNGGSGSEKYLTASSNPANVTTAITAPTAQALRLTFSGTTANGTNVSWTNGNGAARVVLIAQQNSGNTALANDVTYTGNQAFAAGSRIGSTGWFCVYNGTASSTAISNLSANTTYRVQVIEYNGTAGTEKYLSSPNSPANVTTGSQPTMAGNMDLTVGFTTDLRVAGDTKIVASNILSPNGDGKNDTWNIKNIDLYTNNIVTIFDKSGKTVFNQKSYTNNWDGTYHGSALGEGTYSYVINLGDGSAATRGFITIVRDR